MQSRATIPSTSSEHCYRKTNFSGAPAKIPRHVRKNNTHCQSFFKHSLLYCLFPLLWSDRLIFCSWLVCISTVRFVMPTFLLAEVCGEPVCRVQCEQVSRGLAGLRLYPDLQKSLHEGLSSWVDTLYTFWDNVTHYKTGSIHFLGLMNSATKRHIP